MKLPLLLLLISAVSINAKDIFVNYALPSETAGDGSAEKPFSNFASALKAAKEGDTIKILKVDFPIRDAIVIKSRSNITVDGSFNTFTGVKKVSAKDWKMLSPGLWKRDMRLSKGIAMRYFQLHNGKQIRMGRFFKAPCKNSYKKVDELRNGEWTIIENPGTAQKRSFLYSIYLKLDPSITDITASGVEEPRLKQSNGIELSGKCRNLVFKNIICRNFWNDGFNIHNHVYNATFDTICAIDCGDDGISAHEDSIIKVRNFVSIGNSTGICHIDQVTADHHNCYIEDALGRDLYFKANKDTRLDNTFRNIFIKSSAAGGTFIGFSAQDKLNIEKLTILLTPQSAGYFLMPGKGAKYSAGSIAVLTREPKNMTKFRQELFAKFNGEIEKNKKSR